MSRRLAANDAKQKPSETRPRPIYADFHSPQQASEIDINANAGDEDDEDDYMASSLVTTPGDDPPPKEKPKEKKSVVQNPEPKKPELKQKSKKSEPEKSKPKKPEPIIPEPKPEPIIPQPKPEPIIPEPIVTPEEPKPVEPEPEPPKEPEPEPEAEPEPLVERVPSETIEPTEPEESESELNPEPVVIVEEDQSDEEEPEPFELKEVNKDEVFIQEAKKDVGKGIIVEPIRPVPFPEPEGEGKAAMFVGNLAKIRPRFTLVFQVDSLVNRYTYAMEIQSTCNQTMMYCVKTTEKKGYRVKPHIGVVKPKESVIVNVTLLPHNQYNIDTNRFLVMCMVSHSTHKHLKDPTKLNDIWNKLYENKDKNPDEYMEHELHCAINVSDFLANEDEHFMKNKELEALRKGHKPTPAQHMERPLRPLPGYRPTLRALLKGLPLVRNLSKNNAEEGEPPTERDLIVKLNNTHDILRQHIRCFKCFQVFIVVAICGICLILVMAVSFRTMEPVVPVEKASLYEN